MTTLEQAINTMSAGQKSELTIMDKAMQVLAKKARRAAADLADIEAKYLLEVADAKTDFEQTQIALKILSGVKGYFVCTQFCDLKIESGFTSFEEVVSEVNNYMISVHLEQPQAKLSQYVYEVATNGMMTLVDQKVDSSD